jgi:hypothetical protein
MMTETRHMNGNGHAGPTDREIVVVLQRLASARAQLLKAEQSAEEQPEQTRLAERNHEVEEAHAELLWAQADLITSQKEDRARRSVEMARLHEKQVLRKWGYASFRDYLNERNSVSPTDVYLELARREFDAAQAEWEHLSREMTGAHRPNAPTIVLDLTGDNPRRIA